MNSDHINLSSRHTPGYVEEVLRLGVRIGKAPTGGASVVPRSVVSSFSLQWGSEWAGELL